MWCNSCRESKRRGLQREVIMLMQCQQHGRFPSNTFTWGRALMHGGGQPQRVAGGVQL